jgi:hypothetical protein
MGNNGRQLYVLLTGRSLELDMKRVVAIVVATVVISACAYERDESATNPVATNVMATPKSTFATPTKPAGLTRNEPDSLADSETLEIEFGSRANAHPLLGGEVNIQFARGGGEYSVPDVVWGEHYVLNDPANINYLPIYNLVTIYHLGHLVGLEKESCLTKDVITDIPETHVVSCDIRITSQRFETPVVSQQTVRQTVQGMDVSRPIYRPNYHDTIQGVSVSRDPLLYLGVPDFFVRQWPNGTIVGGTPYVAGAIEFPLEFPVITNFGTAVITYSPEELYTGTKKMITIGPTRVSIEPKKEGPGKRWENSDFSFDVGMDFVRSLNGKPPQIIAFSY